MVKLLAELHGGSVAVASLEGKGACFAAWLPLRRSGQLNLTAANEDPDSPAAKQRERVALVVEDDDLAADLVRLLLEAEGFTVLRATSGESALLVAPQQALSLITLDIELPGIDGWEFLDRLREHDALAQVPVVVVSGRDFDSIALTRGAAAVLQKPISRAQLKSSLASLGLHAVEGQSLKVMVVDDDPKAVEVIAAFLPAPSYSITRVYGGREAIVMAKQLRPELILLDLMMPDVSGFDVVAALQGAPETANIPILVVTAKQITDEDRLALRTSGGVTIPIIGKAGFNRVAFITEVRRALVPR
jgi:CheY-like chemotaxis protein